MEGPNVGCRGLPHPAQAAAQGWVMKGANHPFSRPTHSADRRGTYPAAARSPRH